MALAMLEACIRLSRGTEMPFTMRIGINTGPVVAGVIGIKKFIYDLWGDTVNLASRMESHGVTGEIQVTDAVYERMRAKYLFEPRGKIEIKGRGQQKTYLLKGRLAALETALG
jgi:class 3 adenylate cyclase